MPEALGSFDESDGGAASEAIAKPAGAASHSRADNDETLMVRYAAGDVKAFELLYDRHERAVFRFLLRSVRIAAVADELLQEVWISVVRGAAGYEPRAKFSTWLYRIARSRLIDHWRARDPEVLESLEATVVEDGDLTLAEVIAADASVQPEVKALDKAQARSFVAAVEALPPPQREAFLLHAEGGLTLAQIGELTGCGMETIKSRLRYATAKLREAMQPWRDAQ